MPCKSFLCHSLSVNFVGDLVLHDTRLRVQTTDSLSLSLSRLSLMAELFPNAAGGGAPPAAEPADDGKLIELTSSKLDASDCYARNEASGFPMTNLFIGDSRLGCKSDADEQLILHLAFNEFVKVTKKNLPLDGNIILILAQCSHTRLFYIYIFICFSFCVSF